MLNSLWTGPDSRGSASPARAPAARAERQDDAGPPHVLLQAPRVVDDPFEALAVSVREIDFLSRRLPAHCSCLPVIGRMTAAGGGQYHASRGNGLLCFASTTRTAEKRTRDTNNGAGQPSNPCGQGFPIGARNNQSVDAMPFADHA